VAAASPLSTPRDRLTEFPTDRTAGPDLSGLGPLSGARGRRLDASAFDTIYRDYSPVVLGYVKAHGVEDAEAVTQDVFLALLPQLATARGGAAGIRTLLFSIAHARCVDNHRRRARQPDLIEYHADADRRSSASAEDAVLASVGYDGALSILAILGEDQREVLFLRIIADLPLDQVATIMQKSVGAVKQLQRRALLALKEHPAVEVWKSQ
jgi:RNA polymerase sigma factor (sigma-70 family)